MPYGEDIISTLKVLSAVCKCFMEVKVANPKDISNDSIYFRQVVYQCSLISLILLKFGCFAMIDLDAVLYIFQSALGCMTGGMEVMEEIEILKTMDLESVVDVFAKYKFGGQMEFVKWRELED